MNLPFADLAPQAMARMALLASLGPGFGLILFRLAAQRWIMALTLAALAANVVLLLAMAISYAERPLWALQAADVVIVLAMPLAGPGFAARAGLIMLMLVARGPLQVLAAALALASLALAGHAAAAAPWRLAAAMLHLLAAGAWAGGIIGLWLGLRNDEVDAGARAAAFARPGLFVVLLLFATGIAAAADMMPAPAIALALPWGQLLTAKLLLVMAMLALAWRHRDRLVPAVLAGAPAARPRLMASLRLEAGLWLAVAALMALAGLLDPAGG
jgi:putative copper export protein